ncbi:helix-turn-helix domain-containing protein [Spirillospora sp. NPDC048832]
MTVEHIAMVYAAGGMSASEKHLLGAYCNHTDAHGYCWPGVPRLVDETGMSRATVKRVNAQLRARNLIKSVHRTNPKTGEQITNLTRVNLPLLASMRRPPRDYGDNLIEEITFEGPTTEDAFPQVTPGAQNEPPARLTLSPPGAQNEPPPGLKMSPKTSPETSVEPSSSSASVTPEEEEEEGTDAMKNALTLVDTATAAWLGHRRPTRQERLRLAERVSEALRQGAAPAAVSYALTRDLEPGTVKTTAVQVVMARTRRPGWAEVTPPAPVPPPRDIPECEMHPGRARRPDGECGGCYVDRVAAS